MRLHFSLLGTVAALVVATGLIFSASADTLPVFGKVTANQEALLSFPRHGILSEIMVAPNDVIEQGAVVAELVCTTEKAQRDAAVSSALVRELQYRSQERLLAFSSTTELEVDLADAQWRQSLDEVQIYEAQVEQCRLIAPLSAIVSDVFPDDYSFVAAGQPIIRLMDQSVLYFEFMAPLEWLAFEPYGETVVIQISGYEQVVNGIIDLVYPEVEPVSRTVRMRAALDHVPNSVLIGAPGVVELNRE